MQKKFNVFDTSYPSRSYAELLESYGKYYANMYLKIRSSQAVISFVSLISFRQVKFQVCIFSRTNEKNFSDGIIVERDDVSLRSGLLVDYFGSSRQKNTSNFHEKKNMFAFLKCVVRIPIYSSVKISFRCYADLT